MIEIDIEKYLNSKLGKILNKYEVTIWGTSLNDESSFCIIENDFYCIKITQGKMIINLKSDIFVNRIENFINYYNYYNTSNNKITQVKITQECDKYRYTITSPSLIEFEVVTILKIFNRII